MDISLLTLLQNNKTYNPQYYSYVSLLHPKGKYQFDRNKGYPTKRHLSAIKEFGPTPIHRMTFKPEIYNN